MTSNFGRSYLLRPNFLDYMESPLSQEYINMTEEDRIFLTEVINRARPGQVSSSVQDLTMYDLQLRKVVTPLSEL